jgi:dTDP-glucose 4,6-dehydratase
MISNALAGKPLPIYGDGLNVRDWLYAVDHCSAILRVLQKGMIGETYNIGGDCEKTNIEIVDSICSLLDNLAPIPDGTSYSAQKSFVKDRLGHDHRYGIDSSKICLELGWKAQETFSMAINKTVNSTSFVL